MLSYDWVIAITNIFICNVLRSALKLYTISRQGVEIENCHLRDSLANEKTRSLDLKNELTNAKLRIFHLEKLAETPEVLKDLIPTLFLYLYFLFGLSLCEVLNI